MNSDSLQWITYPIFISSTFRDMDCERDAIRFNVIPRLNEHYRANRVQFQAIDLRVGINTEFAKDDEKENFVLDICFEKILQSRPFFVGLLGERYGWIPDTERWHYVVEKLSSESRPLLNDSQGRSVTEMEILLGAIGNDGQYLSRSIFMFRSKKSYYSMPVEDRSIFQDAYNTSLNPSLRKSNVDRLEHLKKHIIRVAERKKLIDNVCTYDVEWDKEQKTFINMKSFSDILYSKLCDEIDKEIKATPNQLFTWQSQDRFNTETYASLLIHRKVETEWLSGMYQLLKRQDSNQLLFIGENGTGKSTVASLCWFYYVNEGYTVCFARIGISSHSRQMRPILVRWIQQLSGKTDDEFSENILMDSKQTTYAELCQLLNVNVKKAYLRNEKVAFILDGVDMLGSYDVNELYCMWIEDDMTVVLTSHPDCSVVIKAYHPSLLSINLPKLKEFDIDLMLQAKERANNIMLPKTVRDRILTEVETPLQLDLLVALFSQLSIIDFRNIRNKRDGDEMAHINQHLNSLYEHAPKNLSELSLYVIRTIVRRMGLLDKYYILFVYLAASQNGLRESDLSYLLGKDWNPLFFHTLTYIFDSILLGDHFTQYWKISSTAIKDALLEKEDKKVYEEITRYLLTLPDSDLLKREILMYVMIMSENNTIGSEYLNIYNKFKGDSDPKSWFTTSINLLRNNTNHLSCLKHFIKGLPSSEATSFVYYLIQLGVHDINKIPDTIIWTDKLLGDIPIDCLDRTSAYHLAILNMEAQLWEKNTRNPNRKKHLLRAIEALSFCHKIDMQSQNIKDYYCVALSEMADIEMNEGNFDQANKLLQLAMNIN